MTDEHTQSAAPAQPDPADKAAQPAQPKHPDLLLPTHSEEKPDERPEDLSPEDLRLMADTMPGDGPGDD